MDASSSGGFNPANGKSALDHNTFVVDKRFQYISFKDFGMGKYEKCSF